VGLSSRDRSFGIGRHGTALDRGALTDRLWTASDNSADTDTVIVHGGARHPDACTE
jgi:hypothetical protein